MTTELTDLIGAGNTLKRKRRPWGLLSLWAGLLLLTGCTDSGPPPTPTDPVAADIVLPEGIPNDRWFYENVYKSESPVLLDFTATWCPPCQQMKPELEKVEEAYGKRLKVVPVDVDDHGYLAAYFRVTGIPRLIVMQDGVVKADEVGGRRYHEIVKLVSPTVGEP